MPHVHAHPYFLVMTVFWLEAMMQTHFWSTVQSREPGICLAGVCLQRWEEPVSVKQKERALKWCCVADCIAAACAAAGHAGTA